MQRGRWEQNRGRQQDCSEDTDTNDPGDYTSLSGSLSGSLLFNTVVQESFKVIFQTGDDLHIDEDGLAKAAESLIVRDLDSGACRLLGQGALSRSFVGSPVQPKQLQGVGTQWSSWWSEKRRLEKLVWKAAASGDLVALRAHLKMTSTSLGSSSSILKSPSSIHGLTVLHAAAYAGCLECVELLLDASCGVNDMSHEGLTPLHIACQRAHLPVARLLIDWGAYAQSAANDGNTALHFIAAHGHTELIDPFLEHASRRTATATMQSQRLHMHQEHKHRLLNIRNNCMQRPVDVATDIRTFGALMRRASEDGDCGIEIGSRELADSYAGRTPLPKIGILLRNSRADAVARLLAGDAKPSVHAASALEAKIARHHWQFSDCPETSHMDTVAAVCQKDEKNSGMAGRTSWSTRPRLWKKRAYQVTRVLFERSSAWRSAHNGEVAVEV